MQNTIPVQLKSNGGIVALSASIAYDPTALGNPQVNLSQASQAAGMTLTINTNVNGRVGFLVDSASAYPAGVVDMVYITFGIVGRGTQNPALADMNLTELAVTGSPTPLSASDPNGNLVGLGASSGLINTVTGEGQAAVISAADVQAKTPPAPYVPPVDTTPITATPVNTTVKPPPIFLGGHTPADNPATIDLTPLTTATGIVTNSLDKIKANPMLGVGILAVAVYFLFKK